MAILAEAAPGLAWHLPLTEKLDWRHPSPDALDFAEFMRVIDRQPMEEPQIKDSRRYDVAEYEITDTAVARGGHLPVAIAENVMAMCQHLLPDGARHLILGPTGVVVKYEHFEICLVEYQHYDIMVHAPTLFLDGPEMG